MSMVIQLPEQPESGETPEFPGVVTISLAAEMLGISRQAAHKMVRTHRLRAWRLRSAGNDRPLVVLEEEILAFQKQAKTVLNGEGAVFAVVSSAQ